MIILIRIEIHIIIIVNGKITKKNYTCHETLFGDMSLKWLAESWCECNMSISKEIHTQLSCIMYGRIWFLLTGSLALLSSSNSRTPAELSRTSQFYSTWWAETRRKRHQTRVKIRIRPLRFLLSRFVINAILTWGPTRLTSKIKLNNFTKSGVKRFKRAKNRRVTYTNFTNQIYLFIPIYDSLKWPY